MAEKAQALKQAQVMIPFVAQRSKAGVIEGKQYVITTYVLYQGREACDLCERPHQTGRQVVIDTDTGGIRAGSECLHQVSGITPGYMDRAADDQVNLALRVRSLARGRTGGPVSFETTQEALEQLRKSAAEIVSNAQHGESILKEINSISRRFADLSVNDADVQKLGVLTDYLAYLKDARENPEMHSARVATLRGDPTSDARKHTEALTGHPLETPEDLTADQVQEIKAALAALSKLQPATLHNREIDPRDYESRDAYRSDLRRHYETMADEGRTLRGTLQAQYDTVHMGDTWKPMTVPNVVAALTLPCVTPIYDRQDFAFPHFEAPGILFYLQRKHGGEVQSYASPQKHTQEIRTDHPKKRPGANGLERVALPEDRDQLPCWFMAYWIPDTWHKVFPLWQAHGGRGELLKFPGL